eukprot:TRINITY_DN15540_c0_g1_i1.p1 TRINITY_DN15540_c0_g1~~TRINITY_DN15540_c0_g1_i1.p1  ORF type:complete len:662 (-),score=156.44 TRINITY_DN15540_c0_g1_i1:430-2196(-)
MNKGVCTEFTADRKGINIMHSESSDKKPEPHDFIFDSVFDTESVQEDVYDIAAKPIVDCVLEGFNGTILAYGQTSSGKTHTMQGDIDSEEHMGIIPRMVRYVFDRIESASQNMEFTITVSMIEIYMEKIKDLFDPSQDNLKIHEDKQKGIFIPGVTERSVGDEEEVYDFIKIGNANRAIGVTDMNAQSSRSHSIFIMTIQMNDLENYSCKVGKLFLVDLAGSEKISKTGAQGLTLDEAKMINKSLTMLGRVIYSLTEGASHIPYRDSKLTRILQESLGGNSKTCLIITCSPSVFNSDETLSTCRFGMRAKHIKNKAKVNKQMTVAELQLVIQKLEHQVSLRTQRVLLLEKIIIELGGTLPTEEDVHQNIKAMEKERKQKEVEEAAAAYEENEVEVGRPTRTQRDIMYEKEKQQNVELQKEKEEQIINVEQLLTQLKNERANVRNKESKLDSMKKDLAEKTSKLKKMERANAKLVSTSADLKIENSNMKLLIEKLEGENKQLNESLQQLAEELADSNELSKELKDKIEVQQNTFEETLKKKEERYEEKLDSEMKKVSERDALIKDLCFHSAVPAHLKQKNYREHSGCQL